VRFARRRGADSSSGLASREMVGAEGCRITRVRAPGRSAGTAGETKHFDIAARGWS
jgi:hypothetical protein